MAGTDFGHALGLSRALSAMPLSPLVGGYGALLAPQQTLGLSHLGEMPVPPGGRLRVLDGVFGAIGPGRRRHVGTAALRAMRREAPDPAAARLLERLAAVQHADPAALRRVLRYQLTHLLHDHPQGHLPATAAGFGVDPAEAVALVHAAAGRPRLDEGQRTAAEALPDDVLEHRIRCAARRAALLPPPGGDRCEATPTGPGGRVPVPPAARTGTVERPIDTAAAPGRPYALRGFLLGGAAASVRLEEPPLLSLVVR